MSKIDLASYMQPTNKVSIGTYSLAVAALIMRIAESYGIALTASEAIAVVTVVYPAVQWLIPDAPRPTEDKGNASNTD